MNRLARTRASWRVALRIARRDALAHRARSALVVAMIAIPVAVMVAGFTLFVSKDISAAEAALARMGAAQALVTGPTPQVITPGPSDAVVGRVCPGGSMTTGRGSQVLTCSADPKARPLPGLPPGPAGGAGDRSTSPAQVAAALGRHLGARVLPTSDRWYDVRYGDEPRRLLTSLEVDGRDPVAAGLVELYSGRWPTVPGEVLVTDRGLARGLPEAGRLTLRDRSTDAGTREAPTVTLTIVGVAGVAPNLPGGVDVVGLPGGATGAGSSLQDTTYLIARDAPVTWDDVVDLGAYGFAAESRAVIADPPDADHLPAGVFRPDPPLQVTVLPFLLGLALLVEAALLAGPAFAVIAQRQRHTLALVACAGGSCTVLRRVVLAQALVLGVSAAVCGALFGLAGAAVILPVYQDWRPDSSFGAFEVPFTEVGIVLGFAVLAALVAAVAPSWGLGRLDVVAALRGSAAPPRVHRGLPVLGVVLMGFGVAAYVALAVGDLGAWGERVVAVLLGSGLLALVIGAICVVPASLAAAGRVTAWLPLPWRLATRDSARSRGRSTPTVAAVMAGGILLSGFGIAVASFDGVAAARYRPSALEGEARVAVAAEPGDLAASIRRVAPGATARPVSYANLPEPKGSASPADGPVESTAVMLPGPGCEPAQVVASANPETEVPACRGVMVSGSGLPIPSGPIRVGSPADLAHLYSLDARQQKVLENSGVLTALRGLHGRSTADVVTGRVRQQKEGARPVWVRDVSRRTVPIGPLVSASDADGTAALMTPATATSLGLTEMYLEAVYVQGADGPIDDEVEGALTGLAGDQGQVVVERGYVSEVEWVWRLLFGSVAVLIVVATVSTTALSLGEAYRDLATLAAVGAPERLRRQIAAAQSGSLAFLGTLIGLAVGAVPGLLVARLLVAPDPQASVVVPWAALAAALTCVPALAAAFGAGVVPGRPILIRRPS